MEPVSAEIADSADGVKITAGPSTAPEAKNASDSAQDDGI
jgi:hypothetical protein